MVIVAEVEVGAVKFPKAPKLTEPFVSTEEKGLLAVTVRYFFKVCPEEQVVVHATDVPFTHSQNVVLDAVTPLRPVAFCAVVLMPEESPDAEDW